MREIFVRKENPKKQVRLIKKYKREYEKENLVVFCNIIYILRRSGMVIKKERSLVI